MNKIALYKIISISLVLLLFCSNLIDGQSNVHDNYINSYNETYYYNLGEHYEQDSWSATGGTITNHRFISGYTWAFNVSWNYPLPGNAKLTWNYKIEEHEPRTATYNKALPSITITLNNIDQPNICPTDEVTVTGTIPNTQQIRTGISGQIRWYMKKTQNDPSPTYIGTTAGPGGGVTTSTPIELIFRPVDRNIHEGEYIIAQYHTNGSNYPMATSTMAALHINPQGPQVDASDITISETVVSRTSNETHLALKGYTYKGIPYSNTGGWANRTFVLTATTNNINNDVIPPPVPLEAGWNFFTPITIGSWNDVNNIELNQNISNLPSEFTKVKIIFETIAEDECAFNEDFEIPQPNISISQMPTCSDSNNGSITVANIGATHKLYLCTFNSSGDLTSKTYQSEFGPLVSGSSVFSSLSSGEYIVRVEKGPFIIEEYHNLTTPPIGSINIVQGYSSSCSESNYGHVTISELSLGSNTFKSGSNYSGGALSFTISNGTSSINVNNITSISQWPIQINGTSSLPIQGNNLKVSFSNGTCNSPDASVSITSGPLPQFVLSDFEVKNAVCNGGNGSLALKEFDYNSINYNQYSTNLEDFEITYGSNTSALSELPFSYVTTAGTYDFQIKHINSGCHSSVTVPLGEASRVQLTTPIKTDVVCHDAENGSITVSSTLGRTDTGTRYYSISPDPKNIGVIEVTVPGGSTTFSNLPAGNNYKITVDDNCQQNNTVQSLDIIISNYPEVQATVVTTDITCNNFNDGIISVTPSSGVSPFSSVVTGIATVISGLSTGETGSITNLQASTYEVTVTDVNGCNNLYNSGITITNPPKLQITSDDSNITDVTCWEGNDGQIVVNATGGTDDIYFAIYDGDVSDSTDYALNYTHTFNTLNYGTKTIKVTDINNCFVEKDFEVKQPAEYKVNSLTIDAAKCYGGSDGALSITVIGGTPDEGNYTYNLMKVNSDLITSSQVDSKSGNAVSFANLSFGDHYVKILDSSLCLLASDTIELSQPNEMLITKNMSAISCYSTTDITLSADIEGGTAPYSYTWKDVNNDFLSSADSIKVDKGNYFLFVKDAHNCGYGKTAPNLEQPFSVDYTVDKPDTIKVTIDNLQNVDYNGLSNGSITLSSSGGWPFHQYSMDGGEYQNLPEFTGLGIGPHTFNVKDGGNCENSITTTITQPDSFLVSLKSIKDVNCFKGADGQITIHAQGGISPYKFVLDDGQGNVIEQNDSVFVGLPAGNYSASVGYRTYNQLVNNIAIGQPASALSSDITAYQSPKCTFSDGWATVTANGGTSPYTYSWSNLQSASTATTLHSGDYYVVTSDFNNCTDTSTITLYDIAGPELSIGQINDLPCSNSDNVGSITLDVSGGTGPYTIQWNDPNQQTGLTATGLAPGTYSATVTDFDGCISKSKDTLITRPSELIISFDAFKDPACYNDNNGEITASAAGGTPPYQFVWQGIGNAGNTGIISGLPAGVYDLNLTDAHNCVTQGNFELKNPDEIVINLPDSVFICAGQTATLDAGNLGSFYQWTADNGFSSDKQIVNLPEQGDYSVTVSNVEGCSNSKKVHLKYENRQFDAAFLLASQATMADTVVLIEISWPVPDSLEWNITDDFLRLVDGGAYKELIPLETGEYTVGMRAWLAGCEDIVEKTITIVPADGQKELKVAKVDLIQSAKLFPNPNTGNFEVEVKLAYEADVRADLFSIKGLRIIPTKYDSGKKDYLIGFNLMRLEPGVYFVNVSAGDEVRKLKFVVN